MLNFLKKLFVDELQKDIEMNRSNYKTCYDCEGTGVQDALIDCHSCKGKGLVRK